MAETRGRSGGTNRDTGSRGPRLSRWNDPKNPRQPEGPFQTKYPKKEFDDAFRRGVSFEELLAISDAWLDRRARGGRVREISKRATELSTPPRLGGRSKSSPVSGRLKEYKENTWGPGSDLERSYGPQEEADSPFGKMLKWNPVQEERQRPELGEDRTLKRTLEQLLLDPARRGIPGGPANKQALIDAKQREANRLTLSRTPGPGGDKIIGEPPSGFQPVPMPRMLREDSTPIRPASFRTDTEPASVKESDTIVGGPRLSRWVEPENPRPRPFDPEYLPRKPRLNPYDDPEARRRKQGEELQKYLDAWEEELARRGRVREVARLGRELTIPPRLGGRSKSAPTSGRLKEYKETALGLGSDRERRNGPQEVYLPSTTGRVVRQRWTPAMDEEINPSLGRVPHEKTFEERLLDPARRGLPGGPASKQALLDAKRREAMRVFQAAQEQGGDEIVGPIKPPTSPVPMPTWPPGIPWWGESNPIQQASLRTEETPQTPPGSMLSRPQAPPGLRQPDAMERMFGAPADPRPEFLPDPNLVALLGLVGKLLPQPRRVQEVPQGFVDPQQDGTMFKLKKWIQENLVD